MSEQALTPYDNGWAMMAGTTPPVKPNSASSGARSCGSRTGVGPPARSASRSHRTCSSWRWQPPPLGCAGSKAGRSTTASASPDRRCPSARRSATSTRAIGRSERPGSPWTVAQHAFRASHPSTDRRRLHLQHRQLRRPRGRHHARRLDRPHAPGPSYRAAPGRARRGGDADQVRRQVAPGIQDHSLGQHGTAAARQAARIAGPDLKPRGKPIEAPSLRAELDDDIPF
jgi:hypothetical protein